MLIGVRLVKVWARALDPANGPPITSREIEASTIERSVSMGGLRSPGERAAGGG
jgi:hypothetical protein